MSAIEFVLALALAKGLVVLGLLLLMRMGLVSFGQGLYFGLGAYAAALLAHRAGIADGALMMLAGTACAAAVAAVLGLLLARYRGIFFGMLSLAFSMILYGLLVKSSALGSTDGFQVQVRRFAGFALAAGAERRVFFAVSVVATLLLAYLLHRYLASHWGRLSAAIRDNELRVEYLGASVYRVVYVNYIVAAALAGLGGALAALAVGHVAAPFVAAAIFEALRTVANQYAPNVWQMALGAAMLAIIMFLPGGLWTLVRKRTA